MSTAKLRASRSGPIEVFTLEQFLRLPEIKPPLEFLNGRVEQKVSPNFPHSVLCGEAYKKIDNFARRRKIGAAYIELRCSFGGESFVPDLCVFARERIRKDSKGKIPDDILLPPDLAIEILSPGQTIARLSSRLTRCVAKGVRLGWLVQPRRSRVFVFRPGRPAELLEIGAVLDGEDVLPGYRLPLETLFGWLSIED